MFLFFTLFFISDLLARLLSSVREAPVGGKTSRCFKNFKLDPGPCSGNPFPPPHSLPWPHCNMGRSARRPRKRL
jgi:hypothetical protein